MGLKATCIRQVSVRVVDIDSNNDQARRKARIQRTKPSDIQGGRTCCDIGSSNSNTGMKRKTPCASTVALDLETNAEESDGSKSAPIEMSSLGEAIDECVKAIAGKSPSLKKAKMEEEFILTNKRGRGRPVSTGEYALKQARKARERIVREEREERVIFDPTVTITDFQAWSRYESKTAEFMNEIRADSAMDIAARRLDLTNVIKKLVLRYKNLKGTARKEVTDAVCFLQAAIASIAARVGALTEGAMLPREDQEVEALALRNRELAAELLVLRGENKRLQESGRRGAVKIVGLLPQAQKSSKEGVGTSEGTPKGESGETSSMLLAPGEKAMDLDTQERATPPPLMKTRSREALARSNKGRRTALPLPPTVRPPIQGVSKPLGDYPPEVTGERKRRKYDALSAQIQVLLGLREDLIQSPESRSSNLPRVDTPLLLPPSCGSCS